jgi:1-aminocyclopropane-1-carboxylate deaminase/D-cysteine desulfhydrase-like pyridoxal-dependent ACC family enzyme
MNAVRSFPPLPWRTLTVRSPKSTSSPRNRMASLSRRPLSASRSKRARFRYASSAAVPQARIRARTSSAVGTRGIPQSDSHSTYCGARRALSAARSAIPQRSAAARIFLCLGGRRHALINRTKIQNDTLKMNTSQSAPALDRSRTLGDVPWRRAMNTGLRLLLPAPPFPSGRASLAERGFFPTEQELHSALALTFPTRDEIRNRIARFPRVRLACLPTPLQPCPRVSAELNIDLWIKRDDLTGLAFGGNKTRNLEFRMAEAQQSGADVLVFGVEVESNSARQTTAAANMLGLPIVLVLRGRPDTPVQGNLLIDYLLGADVRIIDIAPDADLDAEVERVAGELRRSGRRPFNVNASPMFARASALAYIEAFLEIADQLAPRDMDAVYMSSSAKGLAGLILGSRLTGSRTRIVGVSATHGRGDLRERTAKIATEAAEALGWPEIRITREDAEVTADYVGRAYGAPTPAGNEAVLYLARREGILLDPIYTGKAAAGLFADARAGRIPRGARVVFVHTGGQPALFSHAGTLLDTLRSGT